ncbi:MAG TPA: cytochrome b/b6 domain-containing protein [Luteimonas sp.]|nr:cytochrome b/b6 domain-containing protein [Luteimonas sp.]
MATDGDGRDFEWRTVLRHRAPLRWMHWINVLCLFVLVGSGLQVLNAHPALYWGQVSDFAHPLVAFRDGIPGWMTIPGYRSLAMGRRWHFFFAWLWVINGACYLAWSLASRHLRDELAMRRRDWRGIARLIGDHLRFRHPVGEDALRYNPLQKLAYLGVVFVLAPLAILTGLSMSPQMDSLLGPWLQFIDGRQSARALHFAAMALFVLFFVVHVLMVVYAGPLNHLRSMLTGRFRVRWPRAGGAMGEGGDD